MYGGLLFGTNDPEIIARQASHHNRQVHWGEASTGNVKLALQNCHENLSRQPENQHLCFLVVTRKGDCVGVH